MAVLIYLGRSYVTLHAACGTVSISYHFPVWNEVREGLDWDLGELGSILGLCAIGKVPSFLSRPWTPHWYIEGFDRVTTKVTHHHSCLVR